MYHNQRQMSVKYNVVKLKLMVIIPVTGQGGDIYLVYYL